MSYTTIKEAVQAGIDGVRASGGDVSPDCMVFLERAARGEITLDEARELYLKSELSQ
jgi:hypothetical protein